MKKLYVIMKDEELWYTFTDKTKAEIIFKDSKGFYTDIRIFTDEGSTLQEGTV